MVFVIATSPIPFRNARQMRIEQPIVSAIGSSAYEYVSGMGEFGHDIVFPEFVVGEDPLPHQVDFVNLYRKTYNALPKNYEAAGWDAVHIAAKALEKVGPDAAPEAIAAAMRGPYKGVLATLQPRGRRHDRHRAVQLRLFQAGEWQVHAAAVHRKVGLQLSVASCQ